MRKSGHGHGVKVALCKVYVNFLVGLIILGMLKKSKHSRGVRYGINISVLRKFPELKISHCFWPAYMLGLCQVMSRFQIFGFDVLSILTVIRIISVNETLWYPQFGQVRWTWDIWFPYLRSDICFGIIENDWNSLTCQKPEIWIAILENVSGDIVPDWCFPNHNISRLAISC